MIPPDWAKRLQQTNSILPPKAGEQVEDQREQNTDQNGRAQGKVHRHVLAPVRNVSGKPTEWQPNAGSEQYYRSEQNEEKSDPKKCFAKFTHQLPPERSRLG
jgi:hypothetical protein